MTTGIEHQINEIAVSLRRIVQNLEKLGFRFARRDRVLPGPEHTTDSSIAKLEREVGELPAALKVFWRRVGSIDLNGHHPDWTGCELPDPLIIYPPSVAVFEFDEFLADRDERVRSNFPYLVPIAPDALHKADISGGMWYNVSVPAAADDPPLNDEPHGTTLLGYLKIAIECGGFPGLNEAPAHTWPIAAIRGG